MIRDNREYWLYIDSNILIDTVVFYEGVTWSEYEVNEDGSFTLYAYDKDQRLSFVIPKENAFETDRPTRFDNLPYSEWKYRKHLPNITNYVKAAKDFLGITITNEPTFRDGIDPAIDRNENCSN